jgi:hypothetical protein
VCEFSATNQSYLKKYMRSRPEGIRYLCNLCEFASTTTSQLEKHKESKHEL